MGKYELACQKIQTLDGGSFQALASHYVHNELHVSEFTDLGISFGTTKPAPGTPDCFLVKPNGHLAFVECGHYGGHSAALKKLQEDVEGCLKKERESLKPKELVLDDIICCYSYPRFEPEELAQIKAIDPRRITLVGPHEIADACCSRYPWLASEYLGISSGTGSILDVKTFIDRNEAGAFAPSMKHALVGREDETVSLAALVADHQVTVVTGDSGCGKTRVCLEACERASREEGASLYVVPSTRESLFDDLNTYCSGGGPIILMLDDANELTALRSVVEHALTRPIIKLVATVRNYAKGPVIRELRCLKSIEEFHLTRPTAKQTSEIIISSFEMVGDKLGEHLGEITRGNLRLAMLAAESAQKDFASISSIKQLFDAVYLEKLGMLDEAMQKTICLASLLGAHETVDNENLDRLLPMFGLTREEYLKACGGLHALELMDVAGHYEAVSFEEQNLRDYFIYRALIDLEVVTASDLWPLKGGRGLCVKACQIVSDVYGDEHTIEVVERQALELLHGVPAEERLIVVKTFGVLLGIEGMLVIQKYLDRLRQAGAHPSSLSAFDFSKKRAQGSLSLLVLSATVRYLESPTYAKAAVDALFDALRLIDVEENDLEELLQRRLNHGQLTRMGNYDVQGYVLDRIGRDCLYLEDGRMAACLILFAKGLLQDQVSCTQWGNGREIEFVSYQLLYSQKLIDLRKRCLTLLAALHECPQWRREVERTVLGYAGGIEDYELTVRTQELIQNVFLPVLRLDTFESCERLVWFARATARSRRRAGAAAAQSDCDCGGTVNPDDALVDGTTIGELLPFALSKAQTLALDVSALSYSRRARAVSAYDAIAQRSKGFSPLDWGELFALLGDDAQSFGCAYEVDDVLQEVWDSGHLDSSARDAVVKGYVGSCLRPGALADACIARYFNVCGYDQGRAVIASLATLRRKEWLAAYDVYAIREGVVIDVASLVDSIDDEGEIIPFEAVCRAEGLAPGVFAAYLGALTSRINRGLIRLPFYLPYSPDELDSMLESVDMAGENSRVLEQFVLELYRRDQHGTLEEVAGYLLRKNPRLAPLFVDAYINGEHSYGAFTLAVHIIGSAPIGETFDSLTDYLSDGANSYSWTYRQRRVVLKALLLEGYALGRGAEVDSWIVAESLDEERELCSVTRSIIPSLPYETRARLVLILAEAGIDDDAFSSVAYDWGFEGLSWTGSEIPLLRKQPAYYKSLEDGLVERQMWNYVQLSHEAVLAQEQRIRQTKVREFVDPYLR